MSRLIGPQQFTPSELSARQVAKHASNSLHDGAVFDPDCIDCQRELQPPDNDWSDPVPCEPNRRHFWHSYGFRRLPVRLVTLGVGYGMCVAVIETAKAIWR